MSDWNAGVIDEFRANEGWVGGVFAGRPLLLLHHVGARSGAERVSPLMYQEVPGGFAVFASKGGADTNPGWLYNLRARPDTAVEVGAATIPVRAREVHGAERDRIWTKQKADHPFFADYERKTSRDVIPVIVLDRI